MKTTLPFAFLIGRAARLAALLLTAWLISQPLLAADETPPPANANPPQPAAEKAAGEKSATGNPPADKPAGEKPGADKPATDKPAAEKPAAEKPAEEKSAEEKEPPETLEDKAAKFNNWFDVSVGGIRVEGDKAQFQHNNRSQKGAFGGVEDFHWEQRVGKRGSFQVDGHALAETHDYAVTLELAKPDLGFVRGGYKEYRTWYDGSGGFFPPNSQWFNLYDNDLHLDRGTAWFEGGLTLPDKPEFTFKFTHDYRKGQKDSTEWGDTSLTGGLGTRAIVPTFLQVDEKSDTFEGNVRYTLGKTDLGLGVRYQLIDNQDNTYIRRHPGESGATPDRSVSEKDGVSSDSFNVHAFTQTRFNEKTMLSSGYSFTLLDSDLTGSRIYGLGYDALYDPTFRRQFTGEGFLGLSGGSQMKQYVMNLNLFSTPWQNFSLVPSVRVEKRTTSAFSSYTDLPSSVGLSVPNALFGTSDDGFIEVSERLEARYVGLTNWVLYARGDWVQGQGNLNELLIEPASGTLDFAQNQDYRRTTQKYTAGANWYPSRKLNIDWQYYHKINHDNYSYFTDISAFPITDNDFSTDDANVRVTVRPWNNLTFVSRYDFQLSDMRQTAAGLAEGGSARLHSHIISESVTWYPFARLFFQPSINYVLDKTDTPAQDLGGSAAKVIQSAKNNYWDGSVMAGYSFNAKTDLQAQYFYYRANNYVDNSLFGLPYGAGTEEHGVTLTLIRRINERLRWTLKYGFFNNRDQTTAGRGDYTAHLVYSSMQYRF
jgi:hypothetical protein